jgi:hypothetical protein
LLTAIALAIISIALAISAQKADAASTRAEYVAQIQPFCVAADQQAKAGLKRVVRGFKKAAQRLKKKYGDLEPVPVEEFELKKKDFQKLLQGFGVVFAKILSPLVKAFDGATTQIKTVQPAPGDEAAVSTWLAGRTEFARLYYIAISAGKHGKFKRFATVSVQADDVLQSAQTPVNNFGLGSCFLELPVTGPTPFSAGEALSSWAR